ncbi:SusC/RagA family TonB-linked outer membrane protein [Roseivirga pacifica]
MKKFLLILLVLSVGFQGALMAQTRTVTGVVTGGDDGLGIPRVNITVKGTTRGQATDFDGNYSIEVSSGETLVYSFVGYVSQEILVGNQTTINVVLQPDYGQLDEVVVVGYGSQEKKEITSSVVSVKPEDFNKGNVSNPTQLLAGKVAGLSVTRPGGDPNGGFNIRLRGVSTFGANSSPLIVLDGVPGADLSNVDPNDIASIDVLKDGSAAAIYGARGSSGVILITTTKAGSEQGVTDISFGSFMSIDNKVLNKMEVLSADEFVSRGGTDFGSDTDWMDVITQTGLSYSTNASVSGSFGGTSYRASVNWRKNNGIIKGVDNERLNTRLNLNHSAIDDRLRLNVNLSLTNGEYNRKNNQLFRYAMIYNPTAPVYASDRLEQVGPYFQRDLFDFYNPEAIRKQQLFGGTSKTFLTTYRAEFDILENLTVSAQYTQDRFTGLNGEYYSRKDLQTGFGNRGIAQRTTDDRFTQIITGTLNYSTTLSDDLNMTLLGGLEQQTRTYEGFGTRVRQFLFDEFTWNNLGAGAIRLGNQTNIYSYKSRDILNSAFFRANFNFQGAYFLSASVRSESFSGFGENEKTGYFPAISAGAELTEIADLGPVNSLKLRASYGITGALPPDSDLALPIFENGGRIDLDGDVTTTDDTYVAPSQQQNPNPELKWETKKEFNVGFDFALFDSKITGTVDYYQRNVEDLLFPITVPVGAPNPFDPGNFNTATTTWVNLADLKSGGFEFAASFNGVNLGPVMWTPSVNFTIYDKTQIESLSVTDGLGFEFIRPGGSAPGSPGQNDNATIENRVGSTLGNFWGPRLLSIDENGVWTLSAEIDEIDQFEIIGNGLPKGDFGWNNSFMYGNWDFSFFLRGSFGHDLFNSFRDFYENQDTGSNTWNSVVTDKTEYITSSPQFNDTHIEDATFIRLDNLQLGYNIPTRSEYLSNLRVYVAAQNVFTITNYTGIDPEVRWVDQEQSGDAIGAALTPGIERRDTYLPTRTFTIGFNVNIK